ncbi:hypothetical protein K7432_014643 [Basidiobolus ranarum]|uniref:Clp ATPase C-terminal domain-containing protein n=1 Tax=Basidiobolus ranarum TaxID=34480 RepID=A0ABR2WHB8_9FUNG
MSDEASDLVLRLSYDPTYGARPVRRFLEKHLVTQLSRAILSGELIDHAIVYIGTDGSQFQLAFEIKEGPMFE